MKKTCFYCRFAESIGDGAGHCRRYPPQPGQGWNGWSIVWEDDWCGEWEPEDEEVDEPLADSVNGVNDAKILLKNLLDDAESVFDTEEAHDEH